MSKHSKMFHYKCHLKWHFELSKIKKILAGARFPYKNKHLVRFNSVICTFKCQKIQIYGDNFLSGTEKARKVLSPVKKIHFWLKLPILSFHFWLTNCPKLKIDLHRRYVAQNLQKCVQILIQFSESKSNQNWGCCGPKTIGQKKSEKMVRKKVGKGQKKWSEF